MDAAHAKTEELQHFVAKWYAREPEMRWAEVFCPATLKETFQAWGALQHELRHTLFELSDAHVTEVKTQWWAEECHRIAAKNARHPISLKLQAYPADWSALAKVIIGFHDRAARASDSDEAIAQLMPLASAMHTIETVLFTSIHHAEAAKTIAISMLLHRLPNGLAMEDRARIPMHLLARHSIGAAQLVELRADHAVLKDWARELRARLPERLSKACMLRNARIRFDHVRLSMLIKGDGFAALNSQMNVWRAWRVAHS
jgi:hypothetical protein